MNCVVTGDRMRWNGLNLTWGKFRLDVRKKLFTDRRVVKCWNKLLVVMTPDQLLKQRLVILLDTRFNS